MEARELCATDAGGGEVERLELRKTREGPEGRVGQRRAADVKRLQRSQLAERLGAGVRDVRIAETQRFERLERAQARKPRVCDLAGVEPEASQRILAFDEPQVVLSDFGIRDLQRDDVSP